MTGAQKRLITILSVTFFMGVYILFLRFSVKTKTFWCFGLDFKAKSEEYDILWINLATFFGFFFMIHTTLATSTRLATLKSLPYHGEEPKMISVYNRIMMNTIEQGIIFVSLLYVLSNVNPFKWSQNQFIHLVRIFIISRVIFSLTYIGAELAKKSWWRRLGFVGTYTINLFLVLALLGVNIFKIIKVIPVPKI